MDLVAVNEKEIVQSPEWWNKLKEAVNELIVHDFSRLVQLLYQADVPEEKIKSSSRICADLSSPRILRGALLSSR